LESRPFGSHSFEERFQSASNDLYIEATLQQLSKLVLRGESKQLECPLL